MERAYSSVLSLRDDTTVGGFVRNIHFWAANSLVLVAVLHLPRAFYTGAFHAPRRFNWVIGASSSSELSGYSGGSVPYLRTGAMISMEGK